MDDVTHGDGIHGISSLIEICYSLNMAFIFILVMKRENSLNRRSLTRGSNVWMKNAFYLVTMTLYSDGKLKCLSVNFYKLIK